MTGKMSVHAGRPGLVFALDGRVCAVLSPAQLRLLLALEAYGGPLPVRQASRVIWPGQAGALTGSQRASAARSTTRLLELDLAAQQKVGGPLTLTAQGRRLLERRGELIARVLAASRSPAASALTSWSRYTPP
jgi:hypothetical protein